MRRSILGILVALLLANSALFGCSAQNTSGSQTTSESSLEKTQQSDNASSATTARTGAKWIDSGLYGTFKDAGDIRLEDDFVAYVNRDWAKTAQIPDGETVTSSRVELQRDNDQKKISLLSGEGKDDAELTSMQNLYRVLGDWDARNARGYDDLKPHLDDIAGIKSIDDLNRYFSDPQRNLLGNPMISTTIHQSQLDSSINVMDLSPTQPGDPSTYFEKSENGEEGVQLHADRQMTEYMLTRAGYSQSEAKGIFDKYIDFEQRFAPATIEFMKQRMTEDTKTLVNEYSGDELDSLFKNIPIRSIYEGLGYDMSGKVQITVPDALELYDELYTDANVEDIKACVLVRTIQNFTDYLDRETYEKKAEFYEPVTGTNSVPANDQYALSTAYDMIPGMIDKLFVEYCFNPKVKDQITDITRMMLDAYREMLNGEEWLSGETRAAAIEKLDTMKLHICYPDELPDFSVIKIKSPEEGETVFEAWKTTSDFNRAKNAAKLHLRNDGTQWNDEMHYSSFDAAYTGNENAIYINAGACGGDYYDADWSLEEKLGGVCNIIGHEITHAFDTAGAQYDKDGNLNNWWTDEDYAAFQQRVEKLNAYYSSLVPVPQVSDEPYGEEGALRVNAEAIADLGSMKCQLAIAKKQDSFDYEKYFKHLALIQKSARYEPAEVSYAQTNVHPVECYRFNIPAQNYDEFYQTFGIKEGDGMYLAPEERIAVW
ncbi:MAG: M13 family metallopeptidase [Coriobacteriales bacterium]|nr:M13 family metallopeptidase [Coriobacteriales bacterium]